MMLPLMMVTIKCPLKDTPLVGIAIQFVTPFHVSIFLCTEKNSAYKEGGTFSSLRTRQKLLLLQTICVLFLYSLILTDMLHEQ